MLCAGYSYGSGYYGGSYGSGMMRRLLSTEYPTGERACDLAALRAW